MCIRDSHHTRTSDEVSSPPLAVGRVMFEMCLHLNCRGQNVGGLTGAGECLALARDCGGTRRRPKWTRRLLRDWRACATGRAGSSSASRCVVVLSAFVQPCPVKTDALTERELGYNRMGTCRCEYQRSGSGPVPQECMPQTARYRVRRNCFRG